MPLSSGNWPSNLQQVEIIGPAAGQEILSDESPTPTRLVRKLRAERHVWYFDAHSAPRDLASIGPQDET
jgi:hypothetical protein